jgi:hypothetical protein
MLNTLNPLLKRAIVLIDILLPNMMESMTDTLDAHLIKLLNDIELPIDTKSITDIAEPILAMERIENVDPIAK